MKIFAKSTPPNGYNAFGRHWPHHPAAVFEVTAEEWEAIAANPRIVAIVIPEAPKAPVEVPMPAPESPTMSPTVELPIVPKQQQKAK